MYVCVPHVCLVPVGSEEGIRIPRTRVVDGCEPVTMWLIKANPEPSVRAVSTLYH